MVLSQEQKVWLAALALLVSDARLYSLGRPAKGLPANSPELRAAYDDVLSCGVMLRRLCSFTEYEPEWVSEQFRRSVNDDRSSEQ